MPDEVSDEVSDEDRIQLQKMMLIGYLASNVEAGIIEIGDRPVDDIVNEGVAMLAEALERADTEAEGLEFNPVYDHRPSLVEQALNAQPDIAIVLYATHVEHCVNGILFGQFERMQVPRDTVAPLIRELRLNTKLTALWDLAGIPPVDADFLRLIGQLSEKRNAFVHYKWPSHTEESERLHWEQTKKILEGMPDVVEYFDRTEDKLVWNGRRSEVTDAFIGESDEILGDASDPTD